MHMAAVLIMLRDRALQAGVLRQIIKGFGDLGFPQKYKGKYCPSHTDGGDDGEMVLECQNVGSGFQQGGEFRRHEPGIAEKGLIRIIREMTGKNSARLLEGLGNKFRIKGFVPGNVHANDRILCAKAQCPLGFG